MKVVSINIERHKHFDNVKDFLEREDPEIICLMEVCETDVKILAGEKYPFRVYAPNDLLSHFDEGEGTTGVAILAKVMMDDYEVFYCGEDPNTLSAPIAPDHTHLPVLILANIGQLQIGATHFSWTPNGTIDDRQRSHTDILLDYLSTKGELIVCGDFNIPRGNELYQKLRTSYLDNVPAEIKTTIDPNLHRANMVEAGKVQYVVDYIWSTPQYKVNEVQVVEGVSDHSGLVFEVIQN